MLAFRQIPFPISCFARSAAVLGERLVHDRKPPNAHSTKMNCSIERRANGSSRGENAENVRALARRKSPGIPNLSLSSVSRTFSGQSTAVHPSWLRNRDIVNCIRERPNIKSELTKHVSKTEERRMIRNRCGISRVAENCGLGCEHKGKDTKKDWVSGAFQRRKNGQSASLSDRKARQWTIMFSKLFLWNVAPSKSYDC
jgi:hypothetical protein